jgi:hypothetical protein
VLAYELEEAAPPANLLFMILTILPLVDSDEREGGIDSGFFMLEPGSRPGRGRFFCLKVRLYVIILFGTAGSLD